MKQVLVVGGSGGLGSALVSELLVRGFQVVVAGRTSATDNRVWRSYLIDAASADWRSLYSTIEAESRKPIDAVVFVAGTAAYGRTALFPLKRAQSIFELNFWGCAAAAGVVAQHWAVSGREGKFVAILSIVARRAVPFEAYYAASKAAAARFLECLDLEYAPRRIRFVSALPGTLNTPFRRLAEWYGVRPSSGCEGADVRRTARVICELLESGRSSRVIGWRERLIDLADRLAPGLYDRLILRRRVERALEEDRAEASRAPDVVSAPHASNAGVRVWDREGEDEQRESTCQTSR